MKVMCILALSLALSACSYHVDKATDAADTGAAQGNLSFSQVQSSIMGPKCARCHDWVGSYEGVRVRLDEIRERIQSGDSSRVMPRPGATPLTPSEKAALLAWIDRGGPQSPGENPPAPTPQPPGPPVPSLPPGLYFGYVQQRVLQPKCLSCHHHTKDFDSFVHTKPLLKDMQVRIHAIGTDDQMPPAKKPQLTPEELKLLDDWINAGAPEN